jgi:hypothetical protein
MQARYNPGADPEPGIEVNPHPRLWSEQVARSNYESRDFSTADRRGTIYHEYLHFRIYARGWLYFATLQGGMQPLEAEVQDLAGRVSDYAGRNALEFASETYAALRTGHQFDDEVMGLYWRILGFAGLQEGDV